MKGIIKAEYFAYLGRLAKGCTYCMRGREIVVFITGLCDERCFYCPVSRDKLYKDVILVDDEAVEKLRDIVIEAHRLGAEGAGITGGDPLKVLPRTLKAIRLLKREFGDWFHIHLYTSGRHLTSSVVKMLEDAGLDEIRLHPVSENLLGKVLVAKRVARRLSVGVEVPVLPDRKEELKKLILWLDKHHIDFINLNELEVSPANVNEIMLRGYRVKDDGRSVAGSEEAAMEILEWAESRVKYTSIHYCPARYKDKVQLRLRFFIKALRIKKPYEEVTPFGTLKAKLVKLGAMFSPQKLYGEGLGEAIDDGIALVAVDADTPTDATIIEYYPFSDRFERLKARLARGGLLAKIYRES
ncbi:MAG: radical SAM protein [Pyrodictiaceae archaeon]